MRCPRQIAPSALTFRRRCLHANAEYLHFYRRVKTRGNGLLGDSAKSKIIRVFEHIGRLHESREPAYSVWILRCTGCTLNRLVTNHCAVAKLHREHGNFCFCTTRSPFVIVVVLAQTSGAPTRGISHVTRSPRLITKITIFI